MARAKKVKRTKKDTRARFVELAEQLNDRLQERGREVLGMLIALLAREHILLLGVPGTAKTLLSQLVAKVFEASYFYLLLTKFSVPEEVFGPLALSKLKQDKFERVTKGMLPTADLALLDEIFKANSAILNSLLTLLNERKYHNGGAVVDCPLQTLIGCSNELPEDESLDALADRFLLRYWVGNIKEEDNFRKMLTNTIEDCDVSISLAELQQAQDEVEDVTVPDAIVDTILTVKRETEKAGFVATNRRWKKSLKLLKAYAWIEGSDEVTEDHVMLLQDILWTEPKQIDALAAVVAKAANPLVADIQEIVDAARQTHNALPFNDKVAEEDMATVFNSIVEANATFKGCVDRLNALQNGKARNNKKVLEAIDTVKEMHAESSRLAATVSMSV